MISKLVLCNALPMPLESINFNGQAKVGFDIGKIDVSISVRVVSYFVLRVKVLKLTEGWPPHVEQKQVFGMT